MSDLRHRADRHRADWPQFDRGGVLHRLLMPRTAVGTVVVLGLFLVPVLTGSSYVQGAAALAVLSVIGTMSVCVLFGWGGQLMFAQGAIFGTAAYISGYLEYHGVPSIVAILAGVAGGGALGVAVVIPAGRLSRLQLGLLTFALGVAATRVFAAVSGFNGLPGISPYSIFGWHVEGAVSQLGLGCIVLFLVYAGVSWIRTGSFGRQMLLMKSHPGTLSSIGVNPIRTRLGTFAVASLLLSIGGSLYPAMTGYLNPNSFDIDFVISLLLGAVVGGLTLIEGGLIGGLVVAILPALLESHATIFNFADGVAVMVILILLPSGIVVSIAAVQWRKKRHAAARAANAHRLGEPPTPPADPEGSPGGLAATVAAGSGVAGSAAPAGRPAAPPPDRTVPPPDRTTAPSGRTAPPLLVAEQISKSFAGLQALHDASMSVWPGEFVGLIGSNGAGKSTMVNVLTGYERASAGASIRLGDVDVTRKSPVQRARLGLTRTFQFPSFAEELSVLENVQLANRGGRGRPPKSAEEVRRILRTAELEEVGDELVVDLPFGTQKLTDVCRAIVTAADVIFFDEPAAGMGHRELPLLRALLRLASDAGIALVVVEHNMEFLMGLAERIVVLDFGELLAVGTPDEIAANRNVQEAYLGVSMSTSAGGTA